MVNGHYEGTAYLFSSDCGPIPYQVSGPILDNYRRVVLRGEAPLRDSDCNIIGYRSDRLEFSFLETTTATTRRTIPDVHETHASLPPLTNGANLRVVNIGANDILKMRVDATENSPVVHVIPPNGTGIVYLGHTQKQWVFIQYERANGWVERVFVEEIVPRGGRF